METGEFSPLHKNIPFQGHKIAELSPWKFEDKNDQVGILDLDPEIHNYLALERTTEVANLIDMNWVAEIELNERSATMATTALRASLKFQLADVMRGNERESYSFITLLSDFGGFNDGVTLLPALLMTWYNAKMFSSVQFTIFPIKRKSRPKGMNKLQQ